MRKTAFENFVVRWEHQGFLTGKVTFPLYLHLISWLQLPTTVKWAACFDHVTAWPLLLSSKCLKFSPFFSFFWGGLIINEVYWQSNFESYTNTKLKSWSVTWSNIYVLCQKFKDCQFSQILKRKKNTNNKIFNYFYQLSHLYDREFNFYVRRNTMKVFWWKPILPRVVADVTVPADK